jgi:hypothetical protein
MANGEPPPLVPVMVVMLLLITPVVVPGPNTTLMLQEPLVAGSIGAAIPVVTHELDESTEYWPIVANTMLATGMASSSAAEVTVKDSDAVVLVCTRPKLSDDGATVGCPKAATATKRRAATICAGILNIEFLK